MLKGRLNFQRPPVRRCFFPLFLLHDRLTALPFEKRYIIIQPSARRTFPDDIPPSRLFAANRRIKAAALFPTACAAARHDFVLACLSTVCTTGVPTSGRKLSAASRRYERIKAIALSGRRHSVTQGVGRESSAACATASFYECTILRPSARQQQNVNDILLNRLPTSLLKTCWPFVRPFAQRRLPLRIFQPSARRQNSADISHDCLFDGSPAPTCICTAVFATGSMSVIPKK